MGQRLFVRYGKLGGMAWQFATGIPLLPERWGAFAQSFSLAWCVVVSAWLLAYRYSFKASAKLAFKSFPPPNITGFASVCCKQGIGSFTRPGYRSGLCNHCRCTSSQYSHVEWFGQ